MGRESQSGIVSEMTWKRSYQVVESERVLRFLLEGRQERCGFSMPEGFSPLRSFGWLNERLLGKGFEKPGSAIHI